MTFGTREDVTAGSLCQHDVVVTVPESAAPIIRFVGHLGNIIKAKPS